MIDPRLRSAIADYARRLHARGWVANHDGNVTARAGAAGSDRYLATPTAVSKAEITAESLIVVDEGGRAVQGAGKPFSEIMLHLTVYRSRPDVGAVVHAHPPTATGFALAGPQAARLLDQPLIPEAVVSLGPGVPLVPFSQPGEAACRALAPFTLTHDAVLIENHGVFAWGRDVEQAWLRMELVEHLARIALAAHQLGGVRPLPAHALPPLLEARRKAGLGAAASRGDASTPATGSDGAPLKAVVACAPPPPGSDVVLVERPRSSTLSRPSSHLSAIIREEIAAALKK